MVPANKICIDKYKLEYITKILGVYIRQKCILTVENISTKMGNINGKFFYDELYTCKPFSSTLRWKR